MSGLKLGGPTMSKSLCTDVITEVRAWEGESVTFVEIRTLIYSLNID